MRAWLGGGTEGEGLIGLDLPDVAALVAPRPLTLRVAWNTVSRHVRAGRSIPQMRIRQLVTLRYQLPGEGRHGVNAGEGGSTSEGATSTTTQ